jgi:hypothetical protein
VQTYTIEAFQKPMGYRGVPAYRRIKSLAEVKAMAKLHYSLYIISCTRLKVLFFPNDYCFSIGERKGADYERLLPDEFVSSSSTISDRHMVVPRPGLEDGIVNTLDKLLFLHYKDYRIIESIEELVDFMNNEYVACDKH